MRNVQVTPAPIESAPAAPQVPVVPPPRCAQLFTLEGAETAITAAAVDLPANFYDVTPSDLDVMLRDARHVQYVIGNFLPFSLFCFSFLSFRCRLLLFAKQKLSAATVFIIESINENF